MLLPAAVRGIVPDDGHAAGAFIFLALSLARAPCPPTCARPFSLAARIAQGIPSLFYLSGVRGVRGVCTLRPDVSPSASAESFWLAFWIGLILEGLIKFALIGEIFARVFRPYPYLGSFGKRIICWAGVALVFVLPWLRLCPYR